MTQITMLDRHSQAVAALSMSQHAIPFPDDPTALFAALRDAFTGAVWLDGAAGGEFSIMAAAPREMLVTRDGQTWLTPGRDQPGAGQPQCLGSGDPLSLLAQRQAARHAASSTAPTAPPPFASGAIGYFSYELGRRLQGQHPGRGALPDMAVGLYDGALVLDHRRRRAWLAGEPPAALSRWLADGGHRLSAPGAWQAEGPVEATPGRAGYQQAFNRVMHYLREGDCYQINLARRLRAPFSGDPLGVYARFRDLAGGPFAAYLDLPGGPILSGSPERFLKLRDGRVETCPIKGTRPRQSDPQADRAVRRALLASDKDRAENVMIVDLLRNDLGRGCRIGSVQVPALCQLESFATVHHMVSTVTGTLRPDRSATDLLRDCLPGGSITGAPKYRAMEIIEALEDGPRGVYCGAIGYIGDDGAMDTNIAIRTLTARDGWLEYRAGGGLVIDSRGSDEFDETESKAAAFRRLVEEASQRPGAAIQTQSAIARGSRR